ncbi:MAG: hypothetical protein AAF236_12940 [Verrucomicrobiota bacterium]
MNSSIRVSTPLPKIIVRRFLTLAAAGFLLSAPHQNASGEEFLAGAAAIDVTPDVFPIDLRSGKSNYVHDPFHVRSIAFQNGEGRALFTLLDALGVSREETDEVKEKVSEATGWPVESMSISATHTHTAPKTERETPGSQAYREKRYAGMIESMTAAINRLAPAQVGFGSSDLPEEVYNRRWFLKPGTMPLNPFEQYDEVKMNPNRNDLLRPAAPTDPEICVVDVRDRRGRPLAFLANYSLHYVGRVPNVEHEGRIMGMASADYFGEFSRIFPYRIGGSNPPQEFVAMMTNGTSGDINNIDFDRTRAPRAPFEQIRQVASRAADTAWRAIADVEYAEPAMVASRQRQITLNHREVTDTELAFAERMLERLKAGEKDLPNKADQYARATLNQPERGETLEVLIQAYRIGDQAIVTFPFETLVEIGLEIKERSPFPHTFCISLANGSHGYLPTPEQHELGGYETWMGTCRVEKDSSRILTEALMEMLEELWAL